jgi:hypothetical protein
MRDLITENTNKGLQYYVSTPKTAKDYYEEVSEAFPEVSKKDIERIMNYG